MQTLSIRRTNKGISSAKANYLYWMGRYAERVYLSLHMLRKHHDLMIDQDGNAYIDYCNKMSISNQYATEEQFLYSYLYDTENPVSIIRMLHLLNDNAILIREEITSETLSYIQMSIYFMENAKKENKILSELQTITDYMLAFWGSVDERIAKLDIRRTIKYGKFVESADIHIRFNYPFERIENINIRLNECLEQNSEIFDEIKLLAYKNQMTVEKYCEPLTLYYLNGLFNA